MEAGLRGGLHAVSQDAGWMALQFHPQQAQAYVHAHTLSQPLHARLSSPVVSTPTAQVLGANLTRPSARGGVIAAAAHRDVFLRSPQRQALSHGADAVLDPDNGSRTHTRSFGAACLPICSTDSIITGSTSSDSASVGFRVFGRAGPTRTDGSHDRHSDGRLLPQREVRCYADADRTACSYSRHRLRRAPPFKAGAAATAATITDVSVRTCTTTAVSLSGDGSKMGVRQLSSVAAISAAVGVSCTVCAVICDVSSSRSDGGGIGPSNGSGGGGWVASGRKRLLAAAIVAAALPATLIPTGDAPEPLWYDSNRSWEGPIMDPPPIELTGETSGGPEVPAPSGVRAATQEHCHHRYQSSTLLERERAGDILTSRVVLPGSRSGLGSASRTGAAQLGTKLIRAGPGPPTARPMPTPPDLDCSTVHGTSCTAPPAGGVGDFKRRPKKRLRDAPRTPVDVLQKSSALDSSYDGGMYSRPRKRPVLGPEAAAALAKIANRRTWNGGGGGGGDDDSCRLPSHPAKITRAIKNCTSLVQLHRLYRIAQAQSQLPEKPSKQQIALQSSTAVETDKRPVRATDEGIGAAVSQEGDAAGGGSGGGAVSPVVGRLNDLHLVALLTHLAQLATMKPPSGNRRAGGGDATATSAAEDVDVAAFGWEVAMAIGVRLAAGSEVLSQPRAASNSLWAAAKLGLSLRAAWWEALVAPLLAAAAASNAPVGAVVDLMPPLSLRGRDLCNAVYALGISAAAATSASGGGGGGGLAVSGAARRFESRLRMVGLQLLRACTPVLLRGCKAQELSSLLYGVGLLRLQPGKAWLADCYSPALLAVMPSAGPQVIANVLGALQRIEAPPPADLAAALMLASKAMLECTAAKAAPPPPPPSPLQLWSHYKPLSPDMMATVIWSMGRLNSRKTGRALRQINAPVFDSWLDAAVGASVRVLRRQLAAAAVAAGRRRQEGSLAGARQDDAAPSLEPRALAGLASGLALLQVAPGSVAATAAARGSGSGDGDCDGDGDVWRLLYAAAANLSGVPGDRRPSHGYTSLGSSGVVSCSSSSSSSRRYCRWDPRDIFALLSAAVSGMELTSRDSSASSPSLTVEILTAPGGTLRGPHNDLRQQQQQQQPPPALQSSLQGHHHQEQPNREQERTVAAPAAVTGEASVVAVRPPAELVEALLMRLLSSLKQRQQQPAAAVGQTARTAVESKTTAMATCDSSGDGDGGEGGGHGGVCPDAVLVGCVWALAKLRYRPSPELLTALVIAARGRVARLPPPSLAQLLWSFAVLQDRSPMWRGSQEDSILTLAPGLQRRIRTSVERICGGGGGAAAAVPEVPVGQGPGDGGSTLPPRTIVQLMVSLRRLRVPLPPILLHRVAVALVRPAVQKLSQELQSIKGRLLDGIAASDGSPVLSEASGLHDRVRLLGALASAMAGLCDGVRDWRERNPIHNAGGGGGGVLQDPSNGALLIRRRRRRHDGGNGGGGESGLSPFPMDLRRTGLRLALWEAGWMAISASTVVLEVQKIMQQEHLHVQQKGQRPPPVALQDWCSYLAGMRRMGFQLLPELTTALVVHLAAPEPLTQLQTCCPREVVALACELSHAVAITRQRHRWWRRRPYSAVRLRALRRWLHADQNQGPSRESRSSERSTKAEASQRKDTAPLPLAKGGAGGGGSSAKAVVVEEEGSTCVSVSVSVSAGGYTSDQGSIMERVGDGRSGGGGRLSLQVLVGKSAFTGDLRQRQRQRRRRRHMKWLLRSRVGPALLTAAHRVASPGIQLEEAAVNMVSERQAATLLRALRRLQLRVPQSVVASLMRLATKLAAADVTGVTRSRSSSSSMTVTGLSLADMVRMVSAVAAVMPVLSPVTIVSPSASSPVQAEAVAAVVAAAEEWLAHVTATVEAHLLAAPPIVLLDEVLPMVGKLVQAARRAAWMQEAVQSRVLPATFKACIQVLRGSGAPLPYISRLLDTLLSFMTVATQSKSDRQNESGRGGGGRMPVHRTRTRSSPAQAVAAAVAAAAVQPLSMEISLPDEFWIAVYRASYHQLAMALPHAAVAAAAAAAASTTATVGPPLFTNDLITAAGGTATRLTAAGSDTVRTSSDHRPNTTLYESASRGNVATATTVSLSGRLVVALAYSLARYPPPRPPPDRWMRLMLLAVEADLASLGARDCADLCVSLVRLGCVPGSGWLDRFGMQVELTRALTEKTEHRLLSAAWLGLRQLRDRPHHHNSQHQQQQGQEQKQQQEV